MLSWCQPFIFDTFIARCGLGVVLPRQFQIHCYTTDIDNHSKIISSENISNHEKYKSAFMRNKNNKRMLHRYLPYVYSLPGGCRGSFPQFTSPSDKKSNNHPPPNETIQCVASQIQYSGPSFWNRLQHKKCGTWCKKKRRLMYKAIGLVFFCLECWLDHFTTVDV